MPISSYLCHSLTATVSNDSSITSDCLITESGWGFTNDMLITFLITSVIVILLVWMIMKTNLGYHPAFRQCN
jgi:hypothetical protein